MRRGWGTSLSVYVCVSVYGGREVRHFLSLGSKGQGTTLGGPNCTGVAAGGEEQPLSCSIFHRGNRYCVPFSAIASAFRAAALYSASSRGLTSAVLRGQYVFFSAIEKSWMSRGFDNHLRNFDETMKVIDFVLTKDTVQWNEFRHSKVEIHTILNEK